MPFAGVRAAGAIKKATIVHGTFITCRALPLDILTSLYLPSNTGCIVFDSFVEVEEFPYALGVVRM